MKFFKKDLALRSFFRIMPAEERKVFPMTKFTKFLTKETETMLFKSIIKEVPEDAFGNVTVTCYIVRAKSLSYWKQPVIFTDYGEATFYFEELIKSKIRDEHITQACIEERLKDYWNLGGMEIKTFDHGRINE